MHHGSAALNGNGEAQTDMGGTVTTCVDVGMHCSTYCVIQIYLLRNTDLHNACNEPSQEFHPRRVHLKTGRSSDCLAWWWYRHHQWMSHRQQTGSTGSRSLGCSCCTQKKKLVKHACKQSCHLRSMHCTLSVSQLLACDPISAQCHEQLMCQVADRPW